MFAPFTGDRVIEAINFFAIYAYFRKNANLFVDFKVWQNKNAIKPMY